LEILRTHVTMSSTQTLSIQSTSNPDRELFWQKGRNSYMVAPEGWRL
jgi:hypothetical protein